MAADTSSGRFRRRASADAIRWYALLATVLKSILAVEVWQPGSYTRAMRQVGWMVCALLVGCGGTATPEAATAKEPPAETEEPKSEGDAAPSKDAPAKEDPAAEASPQSGDDLTVILQRVIEDEELDKVLHLEQPGRFPLKVSGKDLPGGLSLTKGTKPVSVVAEPSSKKDPVLVFTSIEVSGKDAVVSYRFDIEGIKGTARLKKGPQGWELTSSRLVER